jgi:hypothetical protein
MAEVRTGQGDVKLSREEFELRPRERFYDPAFETVSGELASSIVSSTSPGTPTTNNELRPRLSGRANPGAPAAPARWGGNGAAGSDWETTCH